MDTINAKKELKSILKKEKTNIICAHIITGSHYSDEKHFILKLNYDKNQYNTFMESLDFQYDAGYGGQILFGTVWLDNNCWLSRGEYDGSEWWDWNQYPEYPDSVKSLKNTLNSV